MARWDGASWSPLGSGMNQWVNTLAVYDDGGGPALYAGGQFRVAGALYVNHVARWNGATWSKLDTGLHPYPSVTVDALAVYDDGSGPALYAGGFFTSASGLPVKNTARWDGSSWSALGSGVSSAVEALVVHDVGSGPALFAGGSFSAAFDSRDSFLAVWGHPPDLEPPTLSCPPSILVPDDFGSPSGETVSFSVTASDCRDPAPTVGCVPPSGSFFPRGTTLVTCTATDASGNQSTCQFPVTVAFKPRRR